MHNPTEKGIDSPVCELSQAMVVAPIAEFSSDACDVRTHMSFERMVESYHDVAWRTLRRLGVAHAQLDDALQKVFLSVHAHYGEIWLGKEQGYVLRVCAGVAANARRARQREVAAHANFALEHASPARSPEDEMVAREAQQALAALLDALPEEQRLVFVLHEFEELTGPEISEVTGAPLGTVASRLRRAREAIVMHAQHKFHGTRSPR